MSRIRKNLDRSWNSRQRQVSRIIKNKIYLNIYFFCVGDYRDNYSPGWKFNHWELKGVPLRLEIGPRDVKQGEYVAVRRDTSEKLSHAKASAVQDIKVLLDSIHSNLLNK